MTIFNFANESTRVSIIPVRYPDLYEFMKTIQASHWVPEDIHYDVDKIDWQSMSVDEKRIVTYQILFFMRIDIDVLSNLASIEPHINCMEAQFYYAAQSYQESIHAISYAQQAQAIMSPSEFEDASDIVKTLPIIRKMYVFVKTYTPETLGVALYVVFMAFIEGVLFSASFAILQWLRENNKLPGITAANSYIMRDENLHTQFSTNLIARHVIEKPPYSKVFKLAEEVIEIMDEFVVESCPVRLIGLNADLMKQYVRYRTDAVLLDMNYIAFYGVKNPFKFMDKLLGNSANKVNFFESHSTEYSLSMDPKNNKLDIDFSQIDEE